MSPNLQKHYKSVAHLIKLNAPNNLLYTTEEVIIEQDNIIDLGCHSCFGYDTVYGFIRENDKWTMAIAMPKLARPEFEGEIIGFQNGNQMVIEDEWAIVNDKIKNFALTERI